jgi:aspartyl-tRNA(Asn)/glutamyl-tRNA(Gln) amidotransferase subunit A
VGQAAERAAQQLADLGAELDEPGFKLGDGEEVFWAFTAMYRSKAYAVNGHLLEERRDELTDYFIEGLEGGKATTSKELYFAQSRINRYRAYARAFFSRYDLLLTPSLAAPAFPIGEHPETLGGKPVAHRLWGFTPFTYPFNMTGNPAATVPIGLSGSGLPIGLQIVGGFAREETVLAAAAAFEQAHPWADRRPPTS